MKCEMKNRHIIKNIPIPRKIKQISEEKKTNYIKHASENQRTMTAHIFL